MLQPVRRSPAEPATSTDDSAVNTGLRDAVERILLPDVSQPAQYLGGEFGSVLKPRPIHTLCLAFPDLYTIGMSQYGLQLLYSLVNARNDWACERVFAPRPDMEAALRAAGLPLYSLESFTPLRDFDIIGFSLQYELSFTGVLTILECGGIPIRCVERNLDQALVIAGGPCCANPEPMSRFIDLFVIGDGEEAILHVADAWIEERERARAEGRDRQSALLHLARRFPYVYAPAFYAVAVDAEGRAGRPRPTKDGLPEGIEPAVVHDFDVFAPDAGRIVPFIETVHDRIAVEIMRGCPGTCKFCQSRVLKRPIRTRPIASIVQQAHGACMATGIRDVSLLSLSTSDYPKFETLVEALREKLRPLDATLSVPSLRVNHQLAATMRTLTTERTSGLTIAPEAALDSMRKRIGKPISTENLLAGCRSAYETGFNRVKMYFMIGLPEETIEDVDGILRLSYDVAFLGKEVRGRMPTITTNVSNFVPKPHTPFERHGMRHGEYFRDTHRHLRQSCRVRSVSIKYHDTETSLLEGLLCRGDRRLDAVIESAWRAGSRLEAWGEHFRPELWKRAVEEHRIPVESIVHEDYPDDAELPWSVIRL